MRILQLTDIHLSSNNCTESEVNHQNYIAVIDFIIKNKNTLRFDAIVVTCDISHDGSSLSYERFFHEIERVNSPYAITPGNHDNPTNMLNDSTKKDNLLPIESIFNEQWALFSLDTVVTGENYGIISTEKLQELENKVQKTPQKNIAIFLHHHIFPVGTPLVDICNIQNPSDFIEFCQRYPIKFVGSGHAHTLFQQKKGNVLFSVSPAVCSQWINGTHEVRFADTHGFSVISLNEPTYIETFFI